MKLTPINTLQLCLDHDDENMWLVMFMFVILYCGFSISLMVAIENHETEEESEQFFQFCSFLLIACILIVFILILLTSFVYILCY